MIVFPAIDIRGGRVVRLEEGDFNRETVFGDDPVATAISFRDQGAQWLHVVDLDGAKGAGADNRPIIRAIAAAVDIPVQTGGGLRDMARVREMLDAGVKRVILGTAAFKDPEFLRKACAAHPGCMGVSIDVRDGLIASHGWQEATTIRDTDFLKRIADWGVAAVVYTDISRDGRMAGTNVEAVRNIQSATTIPVIASGGVTRPADLQVLMAAGLYGAIIGRALYAGTITFKDVAALGK